MIGEKDVPEAGAILMDDYFSNWKKHLIGFFNLVRRKVRFLGVIGTKRNILVIVVLVLCMRLFFSVLWDNMAQAQYEAISRKEIDEEVLDPLNRIKALSFQEDKKETGLVCAEDCPEYLEKLEKKREQEKKVNEKYAHLVKGYPIEDMVPAISGRDEETAAYLIAIAKKESDWGKHSPKKNGRTCYNYWGYKGNYNLSPSGYSCFDSPEHAVQVVGDRITELINKGVNTPERFVVWKCGSSCSGHDPGSVAKWISDVKTYYYKLNS